MADNITLDAGSGGPTVKTDEDGSSNHWQYVKNAYGADGTQTRVTATNGLPIQDDGGSISIDDGGNTITVDGTVTANLGATDNGVLDNIDTNTGNVDTNTTDVPNVIGTDGATGPSKAVSVAGTESGGNLQELLVDSNGRLQVDIVTQLPAGVNSLGAVSLSATDNAVLDNIDTNTGNTDTNTTDVPNVIGTDGSAGPTKCLSVGGTESGGDIQEVRVDSDGHLQVDVLSGGGSGTEYTEDAAAATNPVGGVNILVRDDSPSGQTTTDGDNVAQRGTDYGAAFVQVVDSSGNFIDTFGGSGGTSATDDGAFTAGSGSGTPLMGFATSDSVDSGDVGVVAMSTDRRLHVDAQLVGQDADVTIADGGNSITVDGTVTANLSATDNAVLDNIDSNTDYGATTGGGTESGALRVTVASDSTGVLSVDDNGGTLSVDDGGGAITVDNGGTFAVQSASAGDVAHDSADSGNPVKVGAKAETAISGVTLVADGDRTDLLAGVDGVLITRPHCNLEDIVDGNASNTDGASTSVIAAAGAGIKQYLTSFTIVNTSDTDTYVELKSGTTTQWVAPVPANGGVTHSFSVPLPPNAANEAWNFDMGTAVTTAYCSMVGFKSKV